MSVQVSDDFNRADETPLAGNWTAVSTLVAPNLASNQVVCSALGSNAVIWNAASFGNDQWAQVDVTVWLTDSGLHPGPIVRGVTGARTHYIGQSGCTTTPMVGTNIERRVAGVKTVVANETATTFTAPFTMYLKVTGSTCDYDLRVNGTTVLSGADAGGITSGSIGAFVYAAGDVANTAIDNFVGGDFVAEPSPPRAAFQAMPRGAYF